MIVIAEIRAYLVCGVTAQQIEVEVEFLPLGEVFAPLRVLSLSGVETPVLRSSCVFLSFVRPDQESSNFLLT